MSQLLNIVRKQGYALIAEIGVNYYDIAISNNISNLDAAKLMCKEARDAGADAVKFQSYKADTIASKYAPAYWDLTEEATTSQYELFQKYDSFGKNEYQEISDYCKKIGVIFLSTPFDFEAVDYLYDMMDIYKISSSDLTNYPFIEYICRKGRPILLSTGAASESEIISTVNLIQSYGVELGLMHCVLEYPTPLEHANLNRIVALKRQFPDLLMGYSDHTKPTSNGEVLGTAFVLGAKILEKHFTLDKTLKGNDHYHAMDVDDLRNIRKNIEQQKEILGQGGLEYLESESEARINARRSIVVTRNMKSGEQITKDDITFKRPGTGISPRLYKNVIGKIVNLDLNEDSILKWEDIN